ncbi:MAG TPA: ABC transporter permease [Actinomycetes bacterium]|nr:ABC transporter permease [Actinomycetes bacterium]
MTLSRGARLAFGAMALVCLAFIYIPLAVVLINSFNASKVFAWPPQSYTTEWWDAAISNPGAREAVLTSVLIAIAATLFALVLGTLIAFALGRYSFFGRQTISLLIVLPLALPGIVTALALRTAFKPALGTSWEWLGVAVGPTVIAAHATFCIVVVYNNVIARLRRMGTNPEEASMDLGAGVFTTFRLVTFPLIRPALVAGAVLAFGLSFDEIVVTLFTAPADVTTLPIWIFQSLFRPNQGPIVNAVAAILILISIVPVYLSQKLSGDPGHAGGRL